MRGVHPVPLTGLGIREVDEAYRGQRVFALVADDEADEIMAARGNTQSLFARRGDEVGNEEGDRTAPGDAVEVFQRGFQVGAGRARLGREDFRNDAQHMGGALGGRNVLLDLVGEKDKSGNILQLDSDDERRKIYS